MIVVVEGVGSYGAGMARAFASAGYRIVEGDRQATVDCRGVGKTDALDAVRIARSVLALGIYELREPRADGARNAPRILLSARQGMRRESTAAVNSLTALVRTEPMGLDARMALTVRQLRQVAAWRARAGEAVDTAVARVEATRLARRVLSLREELKANERQLHLLVQQTAPSPPASTGPATRRITGASPAGPLRTSKPSLSCSTTDLARALTGGLPPKCSRSKYAP